MLKRMTGFTLIEVMIVLALVGILAAFAVPSLRSTVKRSMTVQLGDELRDFIALARHTAVTQQRKIHLCGSSNGTLCITDAADPWTFVIAYVGPSATQQTRLWVRSLVPINEQVTANRTEVVFDRFGRLGPTQQLVLSVYPSATTQPNQTLAAACTITLQTSGNLSISGSNALCR